MKLEKTEDEFGNFVIKACHLVGISHFDREEDEENGVLTRFGHGLIRQMYSLIGNVSPRRTSVVLTFESELSDETFYLAVFQHKGDEFVETFTQDEYQMIRDSQSEERAKERKKPIKPSDSALVKYWLSGNEN